MGSGRESSKRDCASVVGVDLEIVGVVGRSDLDGTGTERRIDGFVADNRADPVDVRNPDVFSDQVFVARILRVDRHAE